MVRSSVYGALLLSVGLITLAWAKGSFCRQSATTPNKRRQVLIGACVLWHLGMKVQG